MALRAWNVGIERNRKAVAAPRFSTKLADSAGLETGIRCAPSIADCDRIAQRAINSENCTSSLTAKSASLVSLRR